MLRLLKQAGSSFCTQLAASEHFNGHVTIQQDITSSIDGAHTARPI
jgi:hypothetical protein